MRIFRLGLLAVSMLSAAHTAFARPAALTHATPVGSPGDWVAPEDYPEVAMRTRMMGASGYKLHLDATGQPVRCEIVSSSGFDVLDTAACQRLMSTARFTPARDRKGKAIEGSYAGRVRWWLPDQQPEPVTERFASMVLSIDQSGKVASCKLVGHVPKREPSPDWTCNEAVSGDPQVGLDFRGGAQGPFATVEVRIADVFTPELRAQVLAPVAGYEERGLSVHRYTVTNGGKRGECQYIEHRGSIYAASNYCQDTRDALFDPPFSAFGEDGVANGFRIMRVLLKSDE